MTTLNGTSILGLLESVFSSVENNTTKPSRYDGNESMESSVKLPESTSFSNYTTPSFEIGSKLWNILNSSSVHQTESFQENLTTTTTYPLVNTTVPEVTIFRQEVQENGGLGTAEYVVIGAALVVAFFATLAVALRLLLPVCRRKSMKNENLMTMPFGIGSIDSKLSGCTNLGADISSQSSGSGSSQEWAQSTGSGPSTDWSDISSDQTKNPSEESSDAGCGESYSVTKNSAEPSGLLRGSMHSLPMFLQDEKLSSTKSSPIPKRRQNEESISVISTHSLEPMRLDQAYRGRWEDNLESCGSLCGGTSSLQGAQSGSRLSLTSGSSYSSNTTFPIPSRDLVRSLHQEKEKRYPSNVRVNPAIRKAKTSPTLSEERPS